MYKPNFMIQSFNYIAIYTSIYTKGLFLYTFMYTNIVMFKSKYAQLKIK